jgi:hypothetical protein
MLVALAGCDHPVTSEPGASEKLDRGEVALIATAPDGTQLWGVRDAGRRVYFASVGASWSETRNCGKSCTRTEYHEVPTASDDPLAAAASAGGAQ